MVKCAKCSKAVGKKMPGAQCSKCNKWLHASCASLTNEQLSTLSATESLDWKCKPCLAGGKPKRISVILPDLEDDESDADHLTGPTQDKVTLYEIRNEVREMRQTVRDIIREELQSTLKFYSEKIDEYEEKIQVYESKVKLMENQVKNVNNIFKNLQLKNEVLEQKIHKIEQAHICNEIEICGIAEDKDEDIKEITIKVGQALEQKTEDVVKAFRVRKPGRPGAAQTARIDKDAPIRVALKDGRRHAWIEAAKKFNITAGNMSMRGTTGDNCRIYVREALTPATAYLLWKAKCELRDKAICKYVWSRDGTIMARVREGSKKVHYIRAESDIEALKTKLSAT
jgi:hypothetical protein